MGEGADYLYEQGQCEYWDDPSGYDNEYDDRRVFTRKTKLPYNRYKNICVECGNEMLERKGPYGTFAGCKGYPKCKHTGIWDEVPESAKQEVSVTVRLNDRESCEGCPFLHRLEPDVGFSPDWHCAYLNKDMLGCSPQKDCPVVK